jgi:hypothetical protein
MYITNTNHNINVNISSTEDNCPSNSSSSNANSLMAVMSAQAANMEDYNNNSLQNENKNISS